eukprot:2556731-Alexandrium_andersonii.AAC.1
MPLVPVWWNVQAGHMHQLTSLDTFEALGTERPPPRKHGNMSTGRLNCQRANVATATSQGL